MTFAPAPALLALAALAADPPPEPAAPTRPNLLFAFADDWGRYASAYAALPEEDGVELGGGPGGRFALSRVAGFATPNFDALAARGVLFTNAHVNAPSCTPCRSSLLTGRPFWSTGRGAILNGAVWDGSIASYPEALRAGGYAVGQTYKVWSPGSPNDAPFFARQYEYERAGRKFNGFSKIVSRADDPAAAKDRLYGEVRANFAAFLDDAEVRDGEVRDGEVRDGGTDQPWHYWFGPTNVHRTWAAGSGKELWDIDPDSLKGKMPPFLPDVAVVRQDFADYLGEVMAFDAALGVLIDELERRGELENTVIVVSGDHGAPGFPRGKCNLYDFGTGVPLVAAGPGVSGGSNGGGPDGAGRVVTDFVGLPDLAPTFLELAGVEKPAGMTAESLVPVLKSDKDGRVDPARDAVAFGRERHVAVANADYKPYPSRGIRTDEYLYVRNYEPSRWPMGTAPGYGEPGEMPDRGPLTYDTRAAFADLDASPTKAFLIEHRFDPAHAPMFAAGLLRRPSAELYHLPTDPHELRNVAADPAHAAARAALSARLNAHLNATGDPRAGGPPGGVRESPVRRPGLPRAPAGRGDPEAPRDPVRDPSRGGPAGPPRYGRIAHALRVPFFSSERYLPPPQGDRTTYVRPRVMVEGERFAPPRFPNPESAVRHVIRESRRGRPRAPVGPRAPVTRRPPPVRSPSRPWSAGWRRGRRSWASPCGTCRRHTGSSARTRRRPPRWCRSRSWPPRTA